MKPSVVGASLVVAAWALAAGPRPSGPCPVREGEPCTLTLKGAGAPAASPECVSDIWSSRLKFTQPGKWSDSNADGSWESVVEIRLDPTRDCGCALFQVFYDEDVASWTVNIGNSPTNNGHGGDEGTTPNAAEVQVINGKLSVFSASRPAPHRVDKLFDETLPPLGGRTMTFEVCDQALAVEMLPTSRDPSPRKWRLETMNSKLLFSSSIYAAFNRVIHSTTAAASHGRVGAGVRRVEISLTP